MTGLKYVNQSFMAAIAFGCLIHLTLHPMGPDPGKALAPIAFALGAVVIPLIFQPVVMLLGAMIVLSQTGLSWMTPEHSSMTSEQVMNGLLFLMLVVCTPLAYPIWNEKGDAEAPGPTWYWMPPLMVLPVSGLLYAGSLQPSWVPLGFIVATLVAQALYGFVLDARRNKELQSKNNPALASEQYEPPLG